MRISEVLKFQGSPCTKDCSGHAAGYKWSMANKGAVTATPSPSFDNGTKIASDQVSNNKVVRPKVRNSQGKFSSATSPTVKPPIKPQAGNPTPTP